MSLKETIRKQSMWLLTGVLLVGVVVGGGWWWWRSQAVVATDDARVKGTIVHLSAKVAGRVDKVLVKEGDKVEAGQTIAVLEQKELTVQLEQAQAALAAAQAKLAAAKAGNRPQEISQSGAGMAQAAASRDNARKNYERVAALYHKGGVAAQQLDSAKTALDVAEAQYEAAQEGYSLTNEGTRAEDINMLQAQVQEAAAAVKTIQLQLDNTNIKAPTNGIVALKSTEVGEVVTVGQPLFSIADLDDVWIAANIEETHIGKIAVGQDVLFTVDAYPGRKFTGTVVEIGAATGSQFALLPNENTTGNFTKVTQRLPVKIQAAAVDDGVLKPGMSTIVEIYTR